MLPAQRRSEMALFIQQNGGIDTETLAKHFGVSLMTARRDLKILEEQNVLKVTWGGAVPVNFLPHEIPYATKAAVMREAKTAIAALAAEMVEDDSCIMLDAGTTTLELAEMLRSRSLTVITSDLQIALLLSSSPSVSVHLAGGWVDPVSASCSDESTTDFFRNLRVTQAFIGASVWDATRGATTSSTAKMRIKRQMITNAGQSILLADSSKYGNFSPWAIADLASFSCIVSDTDLPEAARESVMQTGTPLRLAQLRPGRKKREASKEG